MFYDMMVKKNVQIRRELFEISKSFADLLKPDGGAIILELKPKRYDKVTDSDFVSL